MGVKKIFLSYTLRDTSLNTNILRLFKNKVEQISNIHVYVDILDNKNIIDYQGEVYSRLDQADVFWKINSSKYNSSSWALEEFSIAEQSNKPIFSLEISDINFIVNSSSRKHTETIIKRFLPNEHMSS